MFANEFITSNNAVTAVAAPNLPIVLDAVTKTIEPIVGKAMIAIMDSRIGLRLKLKCWPFESGNANIYTYHIIVSHIAANAGIIATLINLLSLVVGMCTIILASPNTIAIEFISMPVTKVR